MPAGASALDVEATADAFLACDQVIGIGSDAKGERYTTKRIWELERQALASAEEMAGEEGRALVSEVVIARTLAARPSMKPDQEEMVRRLLGGGEGLALVIGEAGAGKTYATVAAAHGWAAEATSLRVAAPTWRAANVLRSEGLEATSVARLLAEFERSAQRGTPVMESGSVLLVDEAGMVDSATLARLIAHAREAEAKLVLIGDPAQLGEIEAGGLFAALAARYEPIVLDEVIRHSHELDREGALRIREGEGGEALAVYRSEGRVIVATDPAARREQMVRDWWASYGAGEDALMVAKRNSEVEKLNALARELMRAEGRLGTEEIEVGEARFAVGDQLITRVNDHKAGIYNRERWRVAEVEAEARTLALDGIDTAKRVCVDSVFLGRVNERDGAPAIQHAYAATTYQAQGATVDRAFVMADPSMDRQEFYVAASRSREETYFYATPEVQLAREEIAPASPHLRKSLEHIAEAAERDGAQVAAHDRALRSAFEGLPTAELRRRRDELRAEAGAEGRVDERHAELQHKLDLFERQLRHAEQSAERIPELPRRQRKAERERVEERVADLREIVERFRKAQRELPISHEVRAEAAVLDHLIAERERAVLHASRLVPPAYIVGELGERPAEPAKQRVWDRAVRGIESYRELNGVVDGDSALGRRPKSGPERSRWETQRRELGESQRRLERSRELGQILDQHRTSGRGIER